MPVPEILLFRGGIELDLDSSVTIQHRNTHRSILVLSDYFTNSKMTIGAASPRRGSVLMIRV